MFTTERFFARIWAFWFLTLMISVLTLGVAPKIVFVPMAVASVLTFFWCIKCAYRSERFADYASLRLCFSLSAMPLFAFVLSMAITYKQKKMGGVTSLAISSLPLILTAVAYALACVFRCKASALHLRGERVEIFESSSANAWLVGGIGAGGSSLLYLFIESYIDPMIVLLYVMILMSVYMVFYNRMNIASLRALKERERRESRYYAFFELEYVRALRGASGLARFFSNRHRH